MIAAANQDLWQGGAACGKTFLVTCTGATNQGVPHPCTDTPTVNVMITDFCPPPGCKGDLDLSHEAFFYHRGSKSWRNHNLLPRVRDQLPIH
ncbi:putative rlpA-like protein, double-psi beta-barrel [Helianthus annuus]|nr:putative rlpA-like protein, double-psi beta-barrel [Helianthus annuus]